MAVRGRPRSIASEHIRVPHKTTLDLLLAEVCLLESLND